MHASSTEIKKSSSVYNILLLGLTQSGKSTFIQGVKRYANPKCDIDYDTIGTGNTSHTETVCVHKIQTNFPIYRAFNKRDKKEITLSELHALSHKAFLEELNRVDIYGDETTEADQCILRIIDTPGLDDTNKHDERNLARILTSVSELGPIHLVLFLVSQPVPLSGAMKTALETYRDTFSSINGLMVFVHTQVKTNYQHPDDKGIKKYWDERTEFLDSAMGRKFPHILLDCNLDETRPLSIWMRQTIVREILLKVQINASVALNTFQIRKSWRMRDVDQQIIRLYLKELSVLEPVDIIIGSDIETIESDVMTQYIKIRECKEFLRNKDTDELEILHETFAYQDWNWFYPRQAIVRTVSDLKFDIDVIKTQEDKGISVIDEEGGVGKKKWSVTLKRGWYCSGSYHAKLYAKCCNKYAIEVATRKQELSNAERALDSLRQRRVREGGLNNLSRGNREVYKKRWRCMDIIARASRETTHLSMFNALAEMDAYNGQVSECAEVVAAIYSTYQGAPSEEVNVEHHWWEAP